MTLLVSLCRANQGILQQKVGLLKALVAKHGDPGARCIYQTVCPMVKASIGQHVRHSMDHMEPAVRAALNAHAEIHYDVRERADENNSWDVAYERLHTIANLFENLVVASKSNDDHNRPVNAMFMLSGDSSEEIQLSSTVARELGFAAHHAIHHLAMIKIIATQSVVGQLKESDLPSDFGRAPSTVNFDQGRQSST